MTQENEVARLMGEAQKQLEEHQVWLKEQMHEWMHTQPGGEWKLQFRMLIQQVDEIKLRMSRADTGSVTIVWEYPDEIITFLKAETTPEHLRKALEGGHLISPDQPSHTVQRVPN